MNCALLALACSATEEQPASSATCGDLVCSTTENVLSCATDCRQYGVPVWRGGPCAAGWSEERIAEAMAPAIAFAGLFQTMEDGLGLTSDLALEADGVLVTLAQDPTHDALPQVFSRLEPGVFATSLVGPGEATLEARFFLGADYEVAGKLGQLITPDLFLAESYVTGAQVSISDLEAVVSYVDTGPLVEMLGFGVEPPNPFALDIFSADWELGIQELEASMVGSVPLADGHAFDYRLDLRARLTDILGGHVVIKLAEHTTSLPGFAVTGVNLSLAERDPRGQVSIEFGSETPLKAVVRYEEWRSEPTIEVSCR